MKTKFTLILFALVTVYTNAQLITTTGSLSVVRQNHTSQLLASGKVLVCGGWNGNVMSPVEYKSAQLYNGGIWTSTGNMLRNRKKLTSVLLTDGNVLVMGGGLTSCEIYNTTTGIWSYTDSLSELANDFCASVVLDNNNVLFVKRYSQTVELYDQVSHTWSTTGTLANMPFSSFGLTKLPDGNVLLTGGEDQSAQLYNVSLGTWSVISNQMLVYRTSTTSILMSNGKVLVVGVDPSYDLTSEIYDPALNSFSTLRTLTEDHSGSELVTMTNGNILLFGTGDIFSIDKKCLVQYSPSGNNWSTAGTFPSSIFGTGMYTVNKIAGGKILYAGGFVGTGGASASAYLVNEASIVAAAASIVENTNDNLFQVYPNPNQGSFVVNSPNSNSEITDISIYDVTGTRVKVIENISSFPLQIDVPTLSKGIYYVKVSLNNEMITEKISIN